MSVKKTTAPYPKPKPGKRLFVKCFLELEGDKLHPSEIRRTKREGLKNINDGEFWYNLTRKYIKLLYGK